MTDTRELCRRTLGAGMASLALLCAGVGCGHRVATAPPATPPTTPQAQATQQQFLQNNPNMPPQEKAMLQKQMQGNPGSH